MSWIYGGWTYQTVSKLKYSNQVAKAIAIVELDKEAVKIKNDASNQGIFVQEDKLSEQISKLPLYNGDGQNDI